MCFSKFTKDFESVLCLSLLGLGDRAEVFSHEIITKLIKNVI